MNRAQPDYYQALGIIPWMERNPTAHTFKVAVICDHLNDQAERLLNAILKSIPLEPQQIHLINSEALDQQIEKITPKLLIAFGDYPINSPLPLIRTFHPNHLLAHPEDKKKVYLALSIVNAKKQPN